MVAAATTAGAQPIEDELVLITPVGKSLSDPALAEFRKHAKQRWDVRTSVISAGTPVAYGRIVEWAGRPQADLFWGGESAQAPPTRSSSSHAAYEVILERDGEAKGWEWARRLAANTGIYAPRSRDLPAVVARDEFAVGFAVPSYFAFEDRLAGFDIKYVAPKTAWITSGPVEFNGGVRSYYEVDVVSVYDDELAQKRYEQVNATFRREIETVAEALKRK